MFDQIFKSPRFINRHLNAPLLHERLIYLQYLADNRSTIDNLQRIAQYLLVIMDYLSFYQLRMVSVNEIKVAAERWARSNGAHHPKSTYSKSAESRFISYTTNWLKHLDCLILPTTLPLPFDNELNQYNLYMRNEQGLAETTISSRQRMLQDFLMEITNRGHSLTDLSSSIIDEILITKHEINGYSRRTIQLYATLIRGFLRYKSSKGLCSPLLAATIKSPRVYKYETLPSSPSWDDVKKMLKSTEGDYPSDIRDRPILMLLSIYGLRCSEVFKLSLEDIDWEAELLHLKRAKTSIPQTFPLILSVGNAMLRYIKEVRPNHCHLREVFLSLRPPFRPLNESSIYRIVQKRMQPLELTIKHHGPHSLRHACATYLINEGVSLKEIADQLGHQNLETTRIYTKVDLKSLRQIAEFDIGDLL